MAAALRIIYHGSLRAHGAVARDVCAAHTPRGPAPPAVSVTVSAAFRVVSYECPDDKVVLTYSSLLRRGMPFILHSWHRTRPRAAPAAAARRAPRPPPPDDVRANRDTVALLALVRLYRYMISH